jgi:hypothetical protein
MIAGIFSHAGAWACDLLPEDLARQPGRTFNRTGVTNMANDDDKDFHRLHKPAPEPLKDQSDKGDKKQD